jgi:hypothetical protein
MWQMRSCGWRRPGQPTVGCPTAPTNWDDPPQPNCGKPLKQPFLTVPWVVPSRSTSRTTQETRRRWKSGSSHHLKVGHPDDPPKGNPRRGARQVRCAHTHEALTVAPELRHHGPQSSRRAPSIRAAPPLMRLAHVPRLDGGGGGDPTTPRSTAPPRSVGMGCAITTHHGHGAHEGAGVGGGWGADLVLCARGAMPTGVPPGRRRRAAGLQNGGSPVFRFSLYESVLPFEATLDSGLVVCHDRGRGD